MSEVRDCKEYVSAESHPDLCFRAHFNPKRPGDLEVNLSYEAWTLPHDDLKAFLRFLGVPATDLDMAKYARKRERRK